MLVRDGFTNALDLRVESCAPSRVDFVCLFFSDCDSIAPTLVVFDVVGSSCSFCFRLSARFLGVGAAKAVGLLGIKRQGDLRAAQDCLKGLGLVFH